MKLIIAALSCALSLSAFAESTQFDKKALCRDIGTAFESAAYYRDRGSNPEWTFETISYTYISATDGTSKSGITTELIKQAVNLVYFNSGFAYARGHSFAFQMEGLCMRDGAPQFQPLK